MIIAYLKNLQQQSHSKKPSKVKMSFCFDNTYLHLKNIFRLLSIKSCVWLPCYHSSTPAWCKNAAMWNHLGWDSEFPLWPVTDFNNKPHLINSKGTSQPLSKQLQLMTPLKDSETKGCIIFIHSKEQRSHHFALGSSKSFLMLQNTHEDLHGHCRNSQQNFWDKEKYLWHDYSNLTSS